MANEYGQGTCGPGPGEWGYAGPDLRMPSGSADVMFPYNKVITMVPLPARPFPAHIIACPYCRQLVARAPGGCCQCGGRLVE